MEFQDGGHVVFLNGTNFESNLAEPTLKVTYHPVNFQINRRKHVLV